MLFLVSHANETDSQSYVIKHIYLHASSLLHAHVYVTLFGYKISPEFYDDEEEDEENEIVGPTQTDVNQCLNNTIEYFEQMNRDCSYGEHYWHSIKQIHSLNLQYPLILDNNSSSKSTFKLTIQTNYPSSKDLTDNSISLYDIEQNTNIYQFEAVNFEQVIQYIFTHIQDYSELIEFCEQVNQTPEQLANTDWGTIAMLCKTSLEQCENPQKINLNLEKIPQSIPVFHSDL